MTDNSTTKFTTFTFGGKPVQRFRVERDDITAATTTPVKTTKALILILDRSGSMCGTIGEVKSTVRKLLTLSEFNDPSLLVSLITYSGQGDVKLHFRRVPVSDIMRAESSQLREIDSIRATYLTCISQSLVMAETVVDDSEVTCITLHTDGFANDSSPSAEVRAINSAVTKLKTHPKVFCNTIAYGGWCDFGLMSSIANNLSGVCIQARDIRQVYDAIHGSMALLAGSMAPAIELAKGRADTVLFVSRSAKKVLGSQDSLLVQGLAASDDKTAYRLFAIDEAAYNSLNVPVNGQDASIEPVFAYARTEIARGALNSAKYALTATRHGELLDFHAKALVSSEVASLAAAIEGELFAPSGYTPLPKYGLPSSGPSVLTVLSVLDAHASTLEVDLKHLTANYKRRGVKRIPGVRKDDGSVEVPTVESRIRTAADSFVKVNGFELNRNTATVNMLVNQPIDLFRADGTKVASADVGGVNIEGLKSFNNYTIVGDGSLTVPELRLRTSDKRTHKALHDLFGDQMGDYVPGESFGINLSKLPLVDYDTNFDAIGPTDVRILAQLTIVSKMLSGIVKGESASLTAEQIAKLKAVYLSPGLNFSPPTTTEYADLQVALSTGTVDTRLSYKIDMGIPELTSLTKLASGNAYLQRRFAATLLNAKVDKPTLDQITAGAVFSVKKLTAATKLDYVDDLAYPLYEGLLGLGDTAPLATVLKLAGCQTPDAFLSVIRAGNKDAVIEAVCNAQEMVERSIEAIYAKIRPLAFYVGASGIVPDSLGAQSMTAEEFTTKFPTAKLSKDEKEEGTFFVLPSGAVLTIFVKGEYFTTGN